MNYTAQIETKKNSKDLHTVFQSEDNIFPNGRAQYHVDLKKDKLLITAQAKDESSLRAVINSITTVIQIYEKSRKLTE